MRYLPVLLVFSLLSACGADPSDELGATAFPEVEMVDAVDANTSGEDFAPAPTQRRAFFGDLHVHTMYSFDAFIFGTTASPDDAYRFATGGVVRHPGGFDMQLDRPLDFYGVSDHAFYIGSLRAMADPHSPLASHELSKGMDSLDTPLKMRTKFVAIISYLRGKHRYELLNKEVSIDAWEDIKAAAERHYDPGRFTTFLAYEYTSSGPTYDNLHRNVIFSGGRGPQLPFSRIDSINPEDLWRWMDRLRRKGIDAIAIPHNSNGSNGSMFKLVDYNGNPLSAAYADLRMRNEPLVEITQIKGTSETHPALSPYDEWANFEIMPYRIATTLASRPSGSYVREALANGIALQSTQGFNPFKFGVIGSSDTHNASYAGDESNYWSKVGLVDGTPARRGSVPLPDSDPLQPEYADVYYSTWGAAGLAGVYAEENTRAAIFAAFRRKETFGTSGPRMQIRLFAGYDLVSPSKWNAVRTAYLKGVPMGGDLIGVDSSPDFVVMAMRDARSAGLQRLQIVKATTSNGGISETVFDVACAGGMVPDPRTHRCPANGATVNLANCSIREPTAAAELRVKWTDPTYDPARSALYYARVLENPVCRWSTWDAIRNGYAPNPALQATIQERAWSSPIWVSAARS